MAKSKAESDKTTKSKAPRKLPVDLVEKYRPLATKLPAERVQICRADVRIAAYNVKLGVESIFGSGEDKAEREAKIKAIAEQLPKASTRKALELPEIARALVLTAQKVTPAVSTRDIEGKLAVVTELREPILRAAELLAGKGHLPADEVAKIRAGTGTYDQASDGVALALLFSRHEKNVAGKHPFPAEDFTKLREASEWLLDRLTPAGAKKPPQGKREDEDLRDRFWTLIVERHPELRVMGYVLFQEAFDDRVPRLQSRLAGARADDTGAGAGEGGPEAPPAAGV
jgi:hypothetical protein